MMRRSPEMVFAGKTFMILGSTGLSAAVLFLTIASFAGAAGNSVASEYLFMSGVLLPATGAVLGAGISLFVVGSQSVPKTDESQVWLAPTKLTLTF